MSGQETAMVDLDEEDFAAATASLAEHHGQLVVAEAPPAGLPALCADGAEDEDEDEADPDLPLAGTAAQSLADPSPSVPHAHVLEQYADDLAAYPAAAAAAAGGVRLLWLADVARAAGLVVTEVAGWRTRGRLSDGSGQALAPAYVLVHSTAEARNGSEAGGLGGVVHGTPSAPPPVSQVYLGRTGRVFIVASGVANHAGSGNARAAGAPRVHGNAPAIGIEHANDNRGEPWTPVMYAASVRLTAAYLRKLRQPAHHALAHREWSTTGKTDPRGIDMSAYRAAVGRHLQPKPIPAPAPGPWPRVPMNVTAMPTSLASTAFSHDMRTVPWSSLPDLCAGSGGASVTGQGSEHQQEQIRAAVRWFHDVARTLFKTAMIPAHEYQGREIGPGSLAFARLLHQKTATTWRGCVQGPTWRILGHRRDHW